MRVTLHNTDRIVEVNGIPGRVWEGTAETGQRVFAVITRIAVHESEDQRPFIEALRETTPASDAASQAIPLRMII